MMNSINIDTNSDKKSSKFSRVSENEINLIDNESPDNPDTSKKKRKKSKKALYNVSIGFTKLDKIKITVTEKRNPDVIFLRKLNYNELLDIDNFFALFNSLDEIIVELDELITDNRIILTPIENSKKMLFEFYAMVNDKERKISIILFKKFNEQADAINNLCKIIYEQDKKLDAIKNENLLLKNEILMLNKKVDEKIEEKVYMENDSVKGTKDDNNDKVSELDRNVIQIRENAAKFTYISPANGIGKCDPKFIMENTRILNHLKEFDFLVQKINRNISYTSKEFYNMKMLYRASEDGDTARIFHEKCDKKYPLLILIKTIKNRRFGGFTQSFYESTDTFTGKQDGSAFIFSLDKLKAYDVQEGQNAICTHRDNGPMFYGNEFCNIYLGDNFFSTKGNVAKAGDRYNTKEDYEINFGKSQFITKDIEIYQIYLTKLSK